MPTGGKETAHEVTLVVVLATQATEIKDSEDKWSTTAVCNNYVGKKKGLSFHRFPLGDKERCEKWQAAV